MTRKKFSLLLVLAAACMVVHHSCTEQKKSRNAAGDLVSKHDGGGSHSFGTNCFSCHSTGGAASISTFAVAGSVLDEARKHTQPRCVVELYTRPKAGGRMVARLQSDESGNFYTTEHIDFSKGLYPTLIGTPGVKEEFKHMRVPIYNGNCNGCHGPTAEKLGID